MGTAFCVQLQLYVFISKPQLSLNWDEEKKNGGQRGGERECTHRTDAKSLARGL